MNKMIKIIVSILGAFDKVMSIFMPLAVALLLINVGGSALGAGNIYIMLIIAMGATIFRGIKPWLN